MLTFLALGDINAAGPWTTLSTSRGIGSNLFGETMEGGVRNGEKDGRQRQSGRGEGR